MDVYYIYEPFGCLTVPIKFSESVTWSNVHWWPFWLHCFELLSGKALFQSLLKTLEIGHLRISLHPLLYPRAYIFPLLHPALLAPGISHTTGRSFVSVQHPIQHTTHILVHKAFPQKIRILSLSQHGKDFPACSPVITPFSLRPYYTRLSPPIIPLPAERLT